MLIENYSENFKLNSFNKIYKRNKGILKKYQECLKLEL